MGMETQPDVAANCAQLTAAIAHSVVDLVQESKHQHQQQDQLGLNQDTHYLFKSSEP